MSLFSSRPTLFFVLVLSVASPMALKGQNLLVNGSFEYGLSGATPFAFTADLYSIPGGTTLQGWSVVSGNVETVTSAYWAPSDGLFSLDLNGTTAGAVAQTFSTTPGATYHVSFALAGNTSHGPSYETRVLVDQTVCGDFSSTSAPNSWFTYGFDFTASGISTTLEFESLVSGSGGAALDNVSVTAIPEPAIGAALAGVLAVGAVLGRRRR